MRQFRLLGPRLGRRQTTLSFILSSRYLIRCHLPRRSCTALLSSDTAYGGSSFAGPDNLDSLKR